MAGQSAVVFGCGTIGIAAAAALKYFGMNKVMLCDRSDFRLNLAKNLGFVTCNIETEIFQDQAIQYFGTQRALQGEAPDIDCWIDAAGAESILDMLFFY